METFRSRYIAVLAALIMVASYVHPVLAQGDGLSDTAVLSPYWEPVVSRWQNLVVHYGEKRQLDPDLIASVIWKESRGVSTVVGPTGAVGLMCVKPFPWRPSPEELRNPWTNVAAGSATLAQVIRDGSGDVYYALAAYNGGWDKIHRGATRRYAADVLDHYVRAVAVKNGFTVDGDWIAVLSVEGLRDHKTITVLGPNLPLSRYTERPLETRGPAVPHGASPHATVSSFTSERGQEARVNLWLLEESSWRPSEEPSMLSLAGRPFSDDTPVRPFAGLPD